jgi:hypothetical protein
MVIGFQIFCQFFLKIVLDTQYLKTYLCIIETNKKYIKSYIVSFKKKLKKFSQMFFFTEMFFNFASTN